jgi:hypothetical protein
MFDLGALLDQLSNGPFATLLYPVYLLLVFITTYYLALVP